MARMTRTAAGTEARWWTVHVRVPGHGTTDFELDPECDTVESIKVLVETATGMPPATFDVALAGRVLADSDGVRSACGRDGATVDVVPRQQQQQQQQAPSQPAGASLGSYFDRVLSQHASAERRGQPQAAAVAAPTAAAAAAQAPEAAEKKPLESYFDCVLKQHAEGKVVETPQLKRRREIRERLERDPMDAVAQKMLEDEIRDENAHQNMEYALEHNPEAFAQVTMLYLDCAVNKEHMVALVDTGAQSSVVSLEYARRCRIDMLMDTRVSGMVAGAGTANIVGKVWACDVAIGGTFYEASFLVVASAHLDCILGLDFMRRYLCTIDLGRGAICIGDNVVPFLPEHLCPSTERDDDDDSGDGDDSAASADKKDEAGGDKA